MKSGVLSSIKTRSIKYIPKYGIHGGSNLCMASLKFLNRPSEDTKVCKSSIVC